MLRGTILQSNSLNFRGSIAWISSADVIDISTDGEACIIFADLWVGRVEIEGKHKRFGTVFVVIGVNVCQGRGAVDDGLGVESELVLMNDTDELLDEHGPNAQNDEDRDDDGALVAVVGLLSDTPQVRVGEEVEYLQKAEHDSAKLWKFK